MIALQDFDIFFITHSCIRHLHFKRGKYHERLNMLYTDSDAFTIGYDCFSCEISNTDKEILGEATK